MRKKKSHPCKQERVHQGPVHVCLFIGIHKLISLEIGRGLKGCPTQGTGQNLQSSQHMLCSLLDPKKCTKEAQQQCRNQDGKESTVSWEAPTLLERNVFPVRRRRESRPILK